MLSYRSYWRSAVLQSIEKADTHVSVQGSTLQVFQAQRSTQPPSIEIQHTTGMSEDDIIVTLQDLGLLQKVSSTKKKDTCHYALNVSAENVKTLVEASRKKGFPFVKEQCLHWAPFNLIK